ncbi:natural cytotoxicity triggering receptor 2 [Peromyscus eremicus]|uniref:natural cytotoxicity triggering receptor 2 n=1 Tax=Peromyscus eremicus TaxID=42410 RepID=UPI0027DCEB2E|nr:natural cytotoxicity triggering receptor 2 [Peromyscus eremicus]
MFLAQNHINWPTKNVLCDLMDTATSQAQSQVPTLFSPSEPMGPALSLSPFLLWEQMAIPPTNPCPFSSLTASAFSQAAWVPHNLVLSQTQSFVSQNGGARAVPVALATATIATALPNCTLDSDPVAISALVPVFYGLLMTKILVLLALLLRVLRNLCGLHRSFLEASNPSQATILRWVSCLPQARAPRSSPKPLNNIILQEKFRT